MSCIIIYLPNEPLGKQGGMERVTHGLSILLREAQHRVILLCRERNRLGESYQPPVPLLFIPPNLKRQEEQAFIRHLIQQEQAEFIIDQTEGGIIGKWGIFTRRSQLPPSWPKFIAVQHSSQYSYLKHYRMIQQKSFQESWTGKAGSIIYHFLYLKIKQYRATRLQKSLFRKLACNYDCIVSLSKGGVEEFKKLCPQVSDKKLATIPNSIEPLPPAPPCRKEFRVLFVGRLDNRAKQVDRLLHIWKIIEPQIPDWYLDIVGDGQDAEWLKNLATELQLSRVRFEGFQNPEPYYKRSSLFCLTSTFEGFGMVLVEAMQHGCIPLAFDSYPAVRDIINPGRTGFLIPPFDLQEYASCLLSLMKNAAQRESMSKECSLSIFKFSKENVSELWEKLFSTLNEKSS